MNKIVDIGIEVSLPILIETRLILQANSGAGKSYAVRKLLEATNGHIQQIVLDLEGEFFTLREKYDFVVFGKGGDYPIHIKYADKLARSLLETNISAIIDLYELKHHERILFVKRFLDSLMNAPKSLWHPVIIVIDEAHQFCSEKQKTESTSAVIDLCTRGRKRGFVPILATQRLSKLNKDAAAECLNKLIGRTGLDIDMKRASDELGFNSKQDMLELRNLKQGEFYAFGPAISNEVIKIKISEVQTSHPKTGTRVYAVPPASEKLKEKLEIFKELPIEAEKEIKTLNDYKDEIHKLKVELRRTEKAIINSDETANLRRQNEQLNSIIIEQRKEFDKQEKFYSVEIKQQISKYETAFEKIAEILKSVTIIIPKRPSIEYPVYENIPSNKEFKDSIDAAKNNIYKTAQVQNNNGLFKITGGAQRMLRVCAMYHPKEVSKIRIATIAGLRHTSGTFGTYIASLKRDGLITQEGNGYYKSTDKGLDEIGDIPELPSGSELVNMWCGIMKGGASRMLKVLADIYPNSMNKQELGGYAEISHTSGTFGTYLATLKRNGLIIVNGQSIMASKELFE